MNVADFAAARSVVITAPPEAVYDFIADLPSMGEISPQCTGGSWEDDQRGAGAYFIGSNAVGDFTWQTRLRVVVADRPREFAWESLGQVEWAEDPPVARWGYTFEAVENGTRVEETWRVLRSYPLLESLEESVRDAIPAMTRDGMEQTLRNLRARLEG